METTSLSAFKDLVDTIEKSKNLIEEHELLSEEELNTLKQTSSLVAKFQREALTEKESRVSAELLAKEKERLVFDAWKIVSALKKDKYALELQLERLKSNKLVERRLGNKRLSAGYKDKQTIKPSPKAENTIQTDNKKQPQTKSNNTTGLSSDALKTSDSNDSKEKEDSVKESVDEDLLFHKEPRSEYTRGNRLEEVYSAGTEDEEVEVEEISSDDTNHARGNSYKHYTPSDMIKLWTAKPYLSRRRHEGGENTTTQETSWYERKDGLKKYSERARDFHARLQNYKVHNKDKVGKSNLEHSKNLKEDTFPSVSGEDISTLKNVARNNGNDGKHVTSSDLHDDVAMSSSSYRYDSTTYHLEENNKASRSKPVRKSLENIGTGSNTNGHEVYGRYAPKKTSPLVSHSLSSSKEVKEKGVRRSRDYINLLDPQPQEKSTSDRNNRAGISKHEKSGVKKIPKTDSHTRLITSPQSLPGGIVSKRIQDLARRLKIGYSTAINKKKTEGIPDPDDMDLRNPCPGLCGLENLGNSCFMNAGLQCLFVIKPLYRFFLEGGHLSLMKNKSKNQQSNSLSILLGRLIEKVYSGCYLTCEPSALFTCLQSKFPQLDAFRQHDCQEFLALFLDALHQELNTANRNPRRSIKQIESKNVRGADHWWRMYNEEHESVIVDTFQGQFRNKVTCSECGHVSVTYQLFSFLSLPLVSQKIQSFVITLIPNNRPGLTNASKPKALRLRVQASKPSSTSQIKQRLISLLPEDERPNYKNLFLAVVRDNSIVGLLHDDRIVTPFNDKHTKLYAYEPLLPPFIDSTNIKSPVNNATTPIQSHESSRQHIKEKNTLLVPLGNTDDTHVNRDGRGRRTRASLPVGYHLTFTCSICLQEKPTIQLLQHDECGNVYCRECLLVSLEEENVRCPDCSRPSSTGRNKELNMKYINVPVMFRHQDPDSEGECTLFGHPNLVTLPYEITGEDLYQHLAVLLPVSSVNKKTRAIQTLPFTLHLVNYQGRYCSRCDRLNGCTGCCLQAEDILVFQNGDHIAIQLFNIIQLEIDKMSRFCDHESMRIKHLTCRLQLQDCLRSFVDREELQDLWSCPDCNQERSATKSMSVVRYPDTLIIHLKRYNQSNLKIFTPVEFPLEDLDMGEFMNSINSPRESFSTGDNVYDLMGCVCHDGDFEGGHYTAYTRHGIKAEWCLFDDYKVTKECPNSSSYKKVYLLFYNRRAGSPLCTSVDETLTPTKISSKTYDRRNSMDDRYMRGNPRTMKSLSSINETNGSEVVAQTSQRPLEDVVHSNSTSTPKEMLKKQNSISGKGVTRNTTQEKVNGVTINISREQEEPRSVTVTIDRQQKESQIEKSNIDRGQRKQHGLTDSPQEVTDSVFTDTDVQEEPSAQCDCSQCNYFRELEQQIKRCRRSVSGTKTKEMIGEFGSLSSRGVSPSTTRETTHKQTTHIRTNTKYAKKGYETRTHEFSDKCPPLASSDSIDSELDDQGSHTTNQTRKYQYHRPSKYSPTSTSSDPVTDIEADAEGSSDNTGRKVGTRGYHVVDNTGTDAGETRSHTKMSDGRDPHRKAGDNEAGNRRGRSNRSSYFRDYDQEDEDPCCRRKRSSSWVDVTEEDIDNESVVTKTTQMTDSAVQCTLLGDHDMEYGSDYECCSSNRSRSDKNKVNSGVQVSLSKPKNKQRSRGNQKSDEHDFDEEEVEFLTRKLIYAVENEDIRYALQLVKEGADPSLLIDGVSAIHLSAGMISSLGFHFTRLFLECGADTNVKSTDGVTPVHVAAMWGQKECLKLLLSKGGNPYSEDAEGRNAVELAKLFENETSANTSKYLGRLDEHYSSLIRSETLSNASLTSQISTSELQYMPYLYESEEEEDCRPRRTRSQLAELIIPKPEMNAEGSVVPGCGSWTRRLKKRVKKNKLVRTVSGNLRRTSSRLAGRFRSIGGRFSRSSDRHRQTYIEDTDSVI